MRFGKLVKHSFFLITALGYGASGWAQAPADNYSNNSSSFVVDPDPLDPLPVNRENIKEGDEIILEDIKEVLDRPPRALAPPVSPTPLPEIVDPDAGGNGAVTETPVETNQAPPGGADSEGAAGGAAAQAQEITPTPVEGIRAGGSRVSNESSSASRITDDPDQGIEKKFHDIYQTYNASPTPNEVWARASENQKMNVYDVQKDDNLYTISQTLFGDSKFWPKIWSLNRDSILNPHLILPGMKIYFFAGDVESPPTLKLSSGAGTGATSDPSSALGDNDTVFMKPLTKTKNSDRSRFPTEIPESLPVSRNGKYFDPKIERFKIQLKPHEYPPDDDPPNPFILSSAEAKSDFTVSKDYLSSLACRENQFVPLVVKNAPEAAPGNFLIVEKLTRIKARLKSTFKYKVVGSVMIDDKLQMRIRNCQQLVDSDTLIISEENIKSLAEPREVLPKSATILDGLDFDTQNFYMTNQYMVVGLEGLNVDNGAELGVFSPEFGRRVGTIKILKRSGPLGIAVVTSADEVIKFGDQIIE